MAVAAGEEDKVMGRVAASFGLGIQYVAGDYQSSRVGSTTSLSRDTSSMRTCKTKEIGKCFGSGFLNNCEGRRNLINMKLKKVSVRSLKVSESRITLVFKTAKTSSETTPT